MTSSLKTHKNDSIYRCCSVTQSCLTLCDPTDFLSFTVSQSLLKLMSIELVMSSNHLILCCPLLLPSVFSASGTFLMNRLFASGGQSIGASALVHLMDILDSFPLGLTSLISLQSKGLSRVFFNTTVQMHQFFSIHLFSQSNSHIHT